MALAKQAHTSARLRLTLLLLVGVTRGGRRWSCAAVRRRLIYSPVGGCLPRSACIERDLSGSILDFVNAIVRMNFQRIGSNSIEVGRARRLQELARHQIVLENDHSVAPAFVVSICLVTCPFAISQRVVEEK